MEETQPPLPGNTDSSPQPAINSQQPIANSPQESVSALDSANPQDSASKTTNEKQETENMDVHHHSHSHGKKNWKAYFWEFLMLFLAVFCGFFAEYQLEHKVEKDREKKFIRLLIQDLKFDTAKLKTIIAARYKKDIVFDSLSYLLGRPDAENFGSDIYYLARFATRTMDIRFIPTDGTMQQLKNSGGLRIINKIYVADSIIRYDVSIRDMMARFEQEMNTSQEYRNAAAMVFDGRVFDEIVGLSKRTGEYSILSRPQGNPPFVRDKEKVFKLFYWIHYMKGNNIISYRNQQSLLRQAENLLQLLEKEYGYK